MKIALVTEFYYPTLGGVQEHVHNFALHAQRRGHHVRIVTPTVDGSTAGCAAVPTTYIGRSVPLRFNGAVGRVTLGRGLGAALQALFDAERFDVVHVHTPLNPVLPLLAVSRSRTLTVGTFHTNFARMPIAPLLSRLGQRYVDRLDAAIGVSKTAVAAIARYFHADYKVIPNGVDLERFRPDAAPLARTPERKRLLWIGRMEPRNGLDRMIDAFAVASAQRSDLELLVVGDGPLRRAYEQRVPAHLVNRVRFAGAVHAARPAYYASADVLCVPATISSFGVTLLEGMATGAPIVASDIDGFRDVMTHEREGLLVDTAHPYTFAAAILRCVGDADFAARAATRGRETAAHYAWPAVTERVLDCYRAATERRARAC